MEPPANPGRFRSTPSSWWTGRTAWSPPCIGHVREGVHRDRRSRRGRLRDRQIAVTVNGIAIGSCPTSPCTVTYNTASRPDGALTIAAIAEDHAGNRSAPATVSVVAVNGIPTDFIVSPTEGAIVRDKVVVAVNVVDAYLQSVECSLDGDLLGTSTNPNFTKTISTLGKLDGPTVVKCTLTDLAGNVSTQTATAIIQNWTEDLDPDTLNLKSHGGTVTLYVEGANVSLLVPAVQESLALVVPGGSPVPLLSVANPSPGDRDHDGVPDLTLKFDRARLEASIRAGVAAHLIDPALPFSVHLFAGTRDLGSDVIRVKDGS